VRVARGLTESDTTDTITHKDQISHAGRREQPPQAAVGDQVINALRGILAGNGWRRAPGWVQPQLGAQCGALVLPVVCALLGGWRM